MDIIKKYIPETYNTLKDKKDIQTFKEVLTKLLGLEGMVFGIIDHYLKIHLHLETANSEFYQQDHPLFNKMLDLSKMTGPLIAIGTKGIQMDDIARVHHYSRENKEKQTKKVQSRMEYNIKINDMKRKHEKLPKEQLSKHIKLYISEHIKYWKNRMSVNDFEAWVDDFNEVSDFINRYNSIYERLRYIEHVLLAMNHRTTSPSKEFIDLFIFTLYDSENGEPINYFNIILDDFKIE